jgi:tRNA nucleotidyltransferase (CCA-adding enzyme)
MPTLPFGDDMHAMLCEIGAIFQKAGFSCYVVGGAVRDHFLGKISLDYDLTTNATPQQVQKLFKNVIPTGLLHGTVTVRHKKHSFEITTFRTEAGYSDARHPDAVSFNATIDEDLQRRDFTINAITYNLATHTFYDPLHGQQDLQNGVLKAIGIATERFAEDALRMLRAVRFIAQIPHLTLDGSTQQAIVSQLLALNKVSKERITQEWCKLLQGQNTSVALELAGEVGMLALLCPYPIHTDQKVTMGLISPTLPLVRAAALFYCAALSNPVANTMTLLTSYKASTRVKKTIAHYQAMSHYLLTTSITSDGDVRRFMAMCGLTSINDVLTLAKAQSLTHSTAFAKETLAGRIEEIATQKPPLSLSDLAVNGQDLLSWGVPAGPKLGLTLHDLLSAVLENPALNEKKALHQLMLATNS